MAVPKRKTSKARRDQRSACKFLRPQVFGECSHCAAPVMPHIVCSNCGYYKGRKVLTTKLDRALKRGEVRRARDEANRTQEPAAPSEETKSE